jgi:nitroimidazol reductase NimA-like FMN-containing flavoprotein (pyridoxamine 5'-phosphate oxidase superfamily)
MMRRKDKEIKSRSAINAVLKDALVLALALSDRGRPYVVPMNFGYDGKCLYLHSAPRGRKIGILKKNPNVCFEAFVQARLVKARDACSWGMRYQSVIGFGKASFIKNAEEKKKALNIIMKKYSGRENHEFSPASLEKVCLIKVRIISLTGKKSRV